MRKKKVVNEEYYAIYKLGAMGLIDPMPAGYSKLSVVTWVALQKKVR